MYFYTKIDPKKIAQNDSECSNSFELVLRFCAENCDKLSLWNLAIKQITN